MAFGHGRNRADLEAVVLTARRVSTSRERLNEVDRLVMIALLRLRSDADGVTVGAEIENRCGRSVTWIPILRLRFQLCSWRPVRVSFRPTRLLLQ